MKHCPSCKIDKDISEFYTRRGNQTHSYCKPCVSEQTKARQRRLKREAIEYKGGKCMDCGGVFHQAAFDFHHEDPSQKEFAIGRRNLSNLTDFVKKELDKCSLLCANCHRVRHAFNPSKL